MSRDSKRELERSDDRQRLMWMQTLLNTLDPLVQARANDNDTSYLDQQRWMLSSLAAGGLRDSLPTTQALARRPFSDGWAGMIEAADDARRELHRQLEFAGDRFYARERLGLTAP